jgi:hypothetical protein
MDTSAQDVTLRRIEHGYDLRSIFRGSDGSTGIIAVAGLSQPSEVQVWIDYDMADPIAERVSLELAGTIAECDVIMTTGPEER